MHSILTLRRQGTIGWEQSLKQLLILRETQAHSRVCFGSLRFDSIAFLARSAHLHFLIGFVELITVIEEEVPEPLPQQTASTNKESRLSMLVHMATNQHPQHSTPFAPINLNPPSTTTNPPSTLSNSSTAVPLAPSSPQPSPHYSQPPKLSPTGSSYVNLNASSPVSRRPPVLPLSLPTPHSSDGIVRSVVINVMHRLLVAKLDKY